MASGATSINNAILRKVASEFLAAVPPIPDEVIVLVNNSQFGKRNSNWIAQTKAWELSQVITALVLIELSPAGKKWGVQLAAIPAGTVPADQRFGGGLESSDAVWREGYGCVDWFFQKSGITSDAPMVTIKWHNPQLHVPGIKSSCHAVSRMLYAAQEFKIAPTDLENPKQPKQNMDTTQRVLNLEKKVLKLEVEIAALELQHTASRTRTPTITCLMYLFQGASVPECPTYDSATRSSTAKTPTSSTSSSITGIISTFNLAPHTDRLSALGSDAQNWLWEQLAERTLWVRAIDVDSEENHISWTKFEGAVEMGRSVVFSHGNYRFW